MANLIHINRITFIVLDALRRRLYPQEPIDFLNYFKTEPWDIYSAEDIVINFIQQSFQRFEPMAREIYREGQPGLLGDARASYDWLHYGAELDVVPLYKDAVTLSEYRRFIEPAAIPYIVRLVTGIPGSNEGVDTENHGFGYHFHYCKARGQRYDRTNLLLTFDPNELPATQPTAPLYWEYHGSGISVNAAAIGLNKRFPIYLVCQDLTKTRAFRDFKNPGQASGIFYPLGRPNPLANVNKVKPKTPYTSR